MKSEDFFWCSISVLIAKDFPKSALLTLFQSVMDRVANRVSKCGLETQKFPSSSPIFGDKVGKGFSDSLGKILGLEKLYF